MKIGIIGSALVGQTLGRKLVEIGQDVVLGTRTPGNLDEKRGMGTSLGEWLDSTDGKGGIATSSAAADHGDVLINATAGTAALKALREAGEEHLDEKILIDVSNPLDFSKGMPPTLTICNTDSLGEQIQQTFPQARVVKALNTVTAPLMIDPRRVGDGDHHLFICGNDDAAKADVKRYLENWFGWRHIIDLGDISMSRGTEMLLPLWVRLWGALGSPMFNLKVVQ